MVEYKGVTVSEAVNFEDNGSISLRNQKIEKLVRELLTAVGEDPNRAGLARTPERVARMVDELLSGYDTDLDELVNDAIFDSDYDETVLVRDITFYSLCEHHLLPFFGRATVAYVPDGKIIGLSKIPRIVEMYARRLQLQERMTEQIADTLEGVLKPKGIAVLLDGNHMCSIMRGVKQTQSRMETSVFRGVLKDDEKLRREFLDAARSVG
ncbi:MAG: GTP cyclohydrolase I FolE [Chloroflexi bacterium]|nr:MAG: GTP cyclohydrolase I FolE [Chloroflexota bacterium]